MTADAASAARRTSHLSPRRLAGSAIYVAALLLAAFAQTSSSTDGSTPLGLKPGSPAGSYGLSGFDNVDLYSGGLNFHLPLLGVGGRGGAGYTMMLPVEQKWTIDHYEDPDTGFVSDTPNYNWWDVIRPGYSPGVLQARYVGWLADSCGTLSNPRYVYRQTQTRLTFTGGDGTEYELVDPTLSGGNHLAVCATSAYSRGRVFVSNDGSGATFVSDADIIDPLVGHSLHAIDSWADNNLSGYLMLRDGTRYRIDGGAVSWIRDRNGNKLTFGASGNDTVITDSLNRQVTISYNVQDVSPYGLCDRITFKGFGGATRTLRVSHTPLGSALKAGYSLQTDAQLFGVYGNGAATENPTVVSAVWLPDTDGVTRAYRFYYNSYAELARVELPTGGAFEYDWAAGLTGGNTYGTFASSTSNQLLVYRRVVERRVLADGVNVTSRTTFSRPESSAGTTVGYVAVDEKDGGGTLLARQQHYFNGTGAAQSMDKTPIAPPTGGTTDGKEYQADSYDTNGVTLLRRTAHTWEASTVLGQGPHVNETDTTLSDANQVAKQTFAYDAYGNQTDVYDYDYGTGAAGALIRRTHTDYLATNPVNGANYAANTDIHLRSLPVRVSLYDAAGAEQGRTTFEYDNYGSDANHAGLTPRPGISGLDAAYTASYTTRGNLTATSRWLLSTGAPVTSYQQYDVAGSVVKAIDPRGSAAMLDFTDRFGAPDGEARGNSQPAELGAQATYAFATSAANALGHTSYTQFDYYTGKPVNAEDANGVVGAGYYNDVLDRPTQLVSAWGTAAQSQTSFSYNDAARVVTTTSDLNAYGDNALKGESLYDQLGRTYETRQYESGSNYSATRKAYDALGRAYQLSNPFRPWQGQSPVWTTTQFDALGRTISVTTPDNAQVTTAYGGNQVTVTDQAGRSRRSQTDALGRMARVIEDPFGSAYVTDYAYDVLGNLRAVAQGTQRRYFMYDSLSRLVRAKLPEQDANGALAVTDSFRAPFDQGANGQWSASYSYDSGGLLTQRTDARGVVTGYGYDALGRLTSVDYSTSALHPYVERYYDGAALGKGRFWNEHAGGNAAGGAEVEHLAVDSYDAEGRPLVQRRQFKAGGVWSAAYQMQRAYNLAGGVLSEVYPSGRSVSYTYDGAGRLSTFAGALGDGVQRTYAAQLGYDEAGRMQQEQFGTSTPLYHKLHYNVRGQLYDVRLSTVAWAADQWNWNRGCLAFYRGALTPDSTANNGDVTAQQHWVPGDDQISTYTYTQQNYGYDALNRLASTNEYRDGAYSFQQAYAYDRWGNRQIDAANTTDGLNKRQFTTDTRTNRLYSPVGGMAYDPAGNLTVDTYSASSAQRQYDGEDRMTLEQNSATSVFTRYTYDADGRRTRRDIGGTVTWMIYGFDGELAAEYAAGGAPSQPQKEYGYRGSELLVTAEPPAGSSGAQPVTWQNAVGVTVSGNSLSKPGAAAWDAGASSAQSMQSGDGYAEFTTSETSTYRMFGLSHGDTNQDYPDIDFALEPAPEGLVYVWEAGVYRGVSVPYASGDRFRVAVEGGVVKYYKISGGATTLIYTSGQAPVYPLLVDTSLFSSGAQIADAVIAGAGQGSGGGGGVKWLVSDHLGTPRMVVDQTGSLSGVRRHDYLPYGEELTTQGGRTSAMGYSSDTLRQQYTGYERDTEIGLNFAEARYHSDQQGRFTSIDPLSSSAKLTDPQSFNRYSYVGNNPMVFSDPTGMGPSPFAGVGNFEAVFSQNRGNNAELEDAEAAYETNLQATIEAAREADSINEGLRQGTITEQEAKDRAANNPMLQVKGASPTQQERFDAAYAEAMKRLEVGQCADLFGGKEKATKTLNSTKFSIGSPSVRDAAEQVKGDKVVLNPSGEFFDTSGKSTPTIYRSDKTGLEYITLNNTEGAAFLLLHILGHRTGVYGNDNAQQMETGILNEKVRAACFSEETPVSIYDILRRRP